MFGLFVLLLLKCLLLVHGENTATVATQVTAAPNATVATPGALTERMALGLRQDSVEEEVLENYFNAGKEVWEAHFNESTAVRAFKQDVRAFKQDVRAFKQFVTSSLAKIVTCKTGRFVVSGSASDSGQAGFTSYHTVSFSGFAGNPTVTVAINSFYRAQQTDDPAWAIYATVESVTSSTARVKINGEDSYITNVGISWVACV